MTKRLVTLALAALFLLATCALAEYPDYLNLASDRPIVKAGANAPTITITAKANDNAVSDKDMYVWKFFRETMGVNLEVTQVPASTFGEKKSLLLASGQLPDLLWNFGLSTSELSKYGNSEGLLLDLTPYITDELTPNIAAWMRTAPEAFAACRVPNGGMYTLPGTSGSGFGYIIEYDRTWFEANDVDVPTTMDDVLDVLRLYKEQNPDGYGIVASANSDRIASWLLGGLGYVLNNGNQPYAPALREGKVVIPAYDELFLEYITYLKTLYDEELIPQEYYTLDQTAVNAIVLEGKALYMAMYAHGVFTDAAGLNWELSQPLTSEYNSVQQVMKPVVPNVIGGVAISAKCEHPELVMRLLDYLFSEEGGYSCFEGPYLHANTVGEFGWTLDPETLTRTNVGYVGGNTDVCCGMPCGNRYGPIQFYPSAEYDITSSMANAQGLGYRVKQYDLSTVAGYYNYSWSQNVAPYYVDSYPKYTYMNEAVSTRVGDLSTLIASYVNAETAKFVTGVRSLDEFEQYRSELAGLGVEEYLEYYQDAYQAYLSQF